jgi:hypothetical protein
MSQIAIKFSLLAVATAAATLLAGAAYAAPEQANGPSKAACTAKQNCIDFESATWSFTTFGSYAPGSYMTADLVPRLPASPNNTHAVKIAKGPGAELWAGVTIWSGAGDTLPPIGLKPTTPTSPNSMTIPMWVYSDTVGRRIKMKIENSGNGGIYVEADAFTTVANKWEVMRFDFANPTGGTWNASNVYDRLSVFPGFGTVPAVAETTYIDNLIYTKAVPAKPCNTGGKQALVGGQFVSDYSATKSAECGSFGFYAGGADDVLWWNGYADTVMAGGHPSQYFGYGTNGVTSLGVGGFVKAPKDGFVIVNPKSVNPADQYKGMSFELWGNDELMRTNPNLKIILKGRPITMPDTSVCTPEVSTMLTGTGAGVQAYSLAFAGFTVGQACGTTANTTAKILAKGVAEMHAQVPAASLYGAGNAGLSPNGLNMGKITFTY